MLLRLFEVALSFRESFICSFHEETCPNQISLFHGVLELKAHTPLYLPFLFGSRGQNSVLMLAQKAFNQLSYCAVFSP